MNYTVENEQVVFDDHYQMLKAKVTYDTFKGSEISTNRLAFYRGDSVAILLYEAESDSVLLTKQFRYPTTKHQQGWMLEIPAGSMEKEECPLTCIKRETLEEMGYQLHQPQQIYSFYPSPGACTEKTYLFYAEVSEKDKVAKGDGNPSENEDIKMVKLPVSEIENWLSEKIIDAKTIVGLQWFLFQKKRS
ncbi:NUDIX domain-containing protein [Jejudonia soesokkakensis]|uniref:GDP-mannose pyrophosphatase n=1 Tax=Jejudonia soesokkakensis TaxID=1323432 RepID=A0ABW2MV59_9FLAO